jgi:hypothetical protein
MKYSIRWFVAGLTAATVGMAHAVPQVSNVTLAQRAGSRLVDISYTLADEPGIITLSIETNGVALSGTEVSSVFGDVSKLVEPGARAMVWNAGLDWPEHVSSNTRARVTVWATNAPPLYCVIDLAGGYAATNYPIYYYASAEAVPGGVTNDQYKTTRLLMRKIPATGGLGFLMGAPQGETGSSSSTLHSVMLTQDFYIGIYEVTQRQYSQLMNVKPSLFTNTVYWESRPVERVSYDTIRGTAAQSGGGWPTTDAVFETSVIGRLRSKTGLAGFDLPTDAQWEYACRAGTVTSLNNGMNITNTTRDANLATLGRYRYNGGLINDGTATSPADCTPENGTATVGSYLPNAWGLYDMHGNVGER